MKNLSNINKIKIKLWWLVLVFFFLWAFLPVSLLSNETSNEVSNEPSRKILTKQELTILDANIPIQLKTIDKVYPFMAKSEFLRFKLKFIGLTAGYATIEMRPPNLQNPNYFFQLTANSAKWLKNIYTLKMTMFSLASPKNFATVKFIEEKFERENYYYASQYFFNNAVTKKNNLQYTWRKNDFYEVKKYTDAILGVSVPAAFFFARNMPLEDGEIYYTLCTFRDRAVPIGVQVVERTNIKSQFGRKDVIVIRPLMRFDGIISDQRDMLIYLSDDDRRVPLEMKAITKYGVFKGILVEGY